MKTRMIVIGLVLIVLGAIWATRQNRTRQWETVNSRVTQCLRTPIGIRRCYAYLVTYTFSVRGTKFEVNERIVGRRAENGPDVPNGVPLPGPNAQIAVSYNPAKPTEATIEPGFSRWPFAAAGLVLFSILLAIVMRIFPQAGGEESSEKFSTQL